MENNLGVVKDADQLDMPAGFRFHPTDEELITHYLSNKAVDSNFSAIAIGEVDMNKIEPWELPCNFLKLDLGPSSVLILFFSIYYCCVS